MVKMEEFNNFSVCTNYILYVSILEWCVLSVLCSCVLRLFRAKIDGVIDILKVVYICRWINEY